MTRTEAKRELKPLKEMDSDIRAVEMEIERLMTIATKMTPSYDGDRVMSESKSRVEEAVIKMNEYKERLSRLMLEDMAYRNECLNKVSQIKPKSLQTLLIYYYFQNNTLERTAELIGKSYQWTYTMFTTALDEYAKI